MADKLNTDYNLSGESFNFGPLSNNNYKVIDVVKTLSKAWKNSRWEISQMNQSFHESKLLKLNCDKALSLIKWEPTIDFDTTLQLTSDWYYSFYKKNSNAFEKCCEQINSFE